MSVPALTHAPGAPVSVTLSPPQADEGSGEVADPSLAAGPATRFFVRQGRTQNDKY